MREVTSTLMGNGGTPPSWEACGAKGPYEAWKAKASSSRRPVCNRPEGHELPHRRYDRDAKILAEWEFAI